MISFRNKLRITYKASALICFVVYGKIIIGDGCMKKENNTNAIGNLYSPYKNSKNDTMTEFYARYMDDIDKYVFIDGKKFCKIIYRCDWYVNDKFTHLAIFENIENLFQDDILVDEQGQEFIIKSFETVSFGGLMPEWYSKTYNLALLGKDYIIGKYLAKK